VPQNSLFLATALRRAGLPLLPRDDDDNDGDADDDENGDRDDDLPLMQAGCGARWWTLG
jgi:hypothetical protein